MSTTAGAAHTPDATATPNTASATEAKQNTMVNTADGAADATDTAATTNSVADMATDATTEAVAGGTVQTTDTTDGTAQTPDATGGAPDAAGIVIVGNELLNGSVSEQNTTPLIAFFHNRGYTIDQIRIVRDHIPTIAAAVARFAERYGYVCTSGGIGATHDDVTMQSVARAFGVSRNKHAEMERYLAAHFPHITSATRSHLSLLPDGARIYPTGGHWPVIRVRNCFVLPGVPRGVLSALKRMEQIIPHQSPFATADLFANCGENTFRSALEQFSIRFPRCRDWLLPGHHR